MSAFVGGVVSSFIVGSAVAAAFQRSCHISFLGKSGALALATIVTSLAGAALCINPMANTINKKCGKGSSLYAWIVLSFCMSTAMGAAEQKFIGSSQSLAEAVTRSALPLFVGGLVIGSMDD